MDFLQKLGSLPIFLLMILIFYFLIIRPQLNQQKKHTNLLKNLKKGDKVITTGGICGKIIDFKSNNTVIINSNNNSTIKIIKNHIVSVEK